MQLTAKFVRLNKHFIIKSCKELGQVCGTYVVGRGWGDVGRGCRQGLGGLGGCMQLCIAAQ